MNLNHLPKTLKPILCPTDCWFWPDQRALEEGDLDLGWKEKHRLEEKQRAVRKKWAANNEEWNPLFFYLVNNEGTEEFEFKRNYWKQRADKNWKDSPDLYSYDEV